MTSVILQLQDALNLVLVNDGEPTYGTTVDSPKSVLNLIFVSTNLANFVTSRTTENNYSSDHFLVTLNIPLNFEKKCDSSTRLRLNKVDWVIFDEQIIQRLPDINMVPDALDIYIYISNQRKF